MSLIFQGTEQTNANTNDIIQSMKIESVNLGETGTFSPIFLDYLKEEPSLKKFYNYPPSRENFKEIIDARSFPSNGRKILVDVLNRQYHSIKLSKAVKENIDALHDEKTFTITTGHQLNIFSGPLYFIYKIVTCILTAKVLKKEYPDYNFVPVYWMASEDHDFAEINHFTLFGKTYSWETDQSGAVGRYNPEAIKSILDALPEKVEIFEKAYLQHKSLADATRYFVNDLFGEEGLVIIDADNSDLKNQFKSVIKDDLTANNAGKIIQDTSSELSSSGYKVQVSPREINLFYMDENLRERIVFNEKIYKILNSELEFTEKEILELVDKSPEKFSPNVVLRPLYQEIILPNIAYVGGPAEIAYWLQLKQVFEFYKISFPILMPRNFGMIVNKTLAKKIKKLNLQVKDLFLGLQSLKNTFIAENTSNNLSLHKEQEVLKQVYLSVLHKALLVDQSLEGMIGAENAKAEKGIENIEKRLKKAEEKNQEVAIKQIENITEKLFPENGLQERTENFLNFYINNPSIIKYFIENFDPFDFRFHIIMENE
ncbi:MAG: bacillithiol biosynthesis cysteine-adding enzyme BshC [Bacteroidota bacterium]|nr:bacillithiol biosynthesis cysteine-adding enzyme BshC [Bacteroidota bacterium]